MHIEGIWDHEDWRTSLTYTLDGQCIFAVHEGEPEDRSISRDFKDCRKLISLMRLAYEAGKRGEPFSSSFSSPELEIFVKLLPDRAGTGS